MTMNKKQLKTSHAIFSEPIRRNIDWNDVVALIKALGRKVTQGDRSRVILNCPFLIYLK
jgi:hypothetical protein